MKRNLLFTICVLPLLLVLAACAESEPSPTETTTPTIAYVECDYCFESVLEEYACRKYDRWNENTPITEATKAVFNAVYAAEMAGDELSIKEQNEIYDKAYEDASRNTICPKCVYGDYRALLEALRERPDAFSEDTFIVEKSECNWCGNYAPSDLRMDNDEPVCIDCITEALHDEKVAKAILEYIEG